MMERLEEQAKLEESLAQQRHELEFGWQEEKAAFEKQVKDLQDDLDQRQTLRSIIDNKQRHLDILSIELGSLRKERSELRARNAELEGNNGMSMRKRMAEGVSRASEHLGSGALKIGSEMRSASPSFTIGGLSIRKRR